MSFAQAIFLLGSIAVIGPVLAHLLARPRYRRVPFTMLQFLQVGKKDVQARRRVRNLLLLLLRCAIIVLIAMLFAGPRVVSEPKTITPTSINYLGLDNSMSMTYADGGRTNFDRMLSAAQETIRGAEDGAVFNVCALASGQWGRNLAKSAALAFVGRVKPVPLSARTEEFLSELNAASRRRAPNVRVKAALVSDFTPKMLAQLAAVVEPVAVDAAAHVLVSSDAPAANCAITSARISRATQKMLSVTVGLANYSAEPAKRMLVAKMKDRPVAQAEAALGAGEERGFNIEVPIDPALGAEPCLAVEFALTGGDGLAADDAFCLSASLPELRTTNVLLCGADAREVFLVKTAVSALSSAEFFQSVNAREMYYSSFEPAALKNYNVAIFAGMGGVLAEAAPAVESFVRGGGRAIFFVSRDSNANAIDRLAKAGVLPALPKQAKSGGASIEPGPCSPDALGSLSATADAAALQNYALDKILLTGYYECEPSPDGVVLWRLKNGPGFLYCQRVGNGWAFLVNTSADDTLGGVMKSPAAVAFSRFLLGGSAEPITHTFTCGDKIALPAIQPEIDAAQAGKPVWVTKPSGESVEALVASGLVLVQSGDSVGWLSTLAKPVRMAAVNLPEGETDVSKPSADAVTQLVAKAFNAEESSVAAADASTDGKEYNPVWRWFAWGLLALVLAEAFIANRTQR